MATKYSDIASSTNYPTGTETNLGLGGYGFSAAQIQALKDAGITYGDLAGIGLDQAPQTTISMPPTYSGAPGGGQSSPQMTQQGKDQVGTANFLKAIMKLGAGSGASGTGGQNQPAGTQVLQSGAGDPGNALNLLGAQALSKIGYNPYDTMTVNPTPGQNMGQGDFAKSGVSPVSGPMTYDISKEPMPGTPGGSGAWRQVGQAAGLSQKDIDTFQSMGRTPQDVAKQFGVTAPTATSTAVTNVPSIFNPAPMPQPTSGGTPFNPATQATAAPMAISQPFAQPPAAPAPMAVPQPSIAQPPAFQPPGAPGAIMGAVPPMPPSWGMVNDKSQLARSVSAPPLQASAASSTVPIPKMATGGLVTGQPGPDNVPAMLSSGEYVMNRNAVDNIGVPNLDMMNARHYEEGGYVAPYQYGAYPPDDRRYQYGTPPTPNWFQRAGQTVGHFLTGKLGQDQPPAAPGSQPAATTNVDKLGTLGDESLVNQITKQPQARAAQGLGSSLTQAGQDLGNAIAQGGKSTYQMVPQAFGTPSASDYQHFYDQMLIDNTRRYT